MSGSGFTLNRRTASDGDAASARQAITVRRERRRPFRITHLDVAVAGLPKSFEGFRLVQLTDLHFGPVTTAALLEKAVAVTNDLRPDAVLLTGDYIQYSALGVWHAIAHRFNPRVFRWIDYRREVRELASRLSPILDRLEASEGIFGVFGNHDHLEGVGSIIRQFPQRITWLTNDSRSIVREGQRIVIAGVDDIKRGRPNLARAVQFACVDGTRGRDESADPVPLFSVLLSHNPDITISSAHHLLQHVDLVLCGHTHGGQICVPVYGPPVTRTRQKEHVHGLTQHHSTPIYTSAGVGFGGIPLRLFCPAEIVSVTLRSSAF